LIPGQSPPAVNIPILIPLLFLPILIYTSLVISKFSFLKGISKNFWLFSTVVLP
jgi:hypothetical protein